MLLHRAALLAPLAAVLLTGCAGQAETRRLAGQTAGLLNDYRREVDEFAKAQSQLNADNDARLRTLESLKAQRQADTDRRLAGMRLSEDKKALAAYQQLTTRSLDDITKTPAFRTLESVPPSSQVSFDSAAAQATVKQLKALEKTPSFWDRATNLQAYYASLQAAYKASVEEATKATQSSQQAVAYVDKEVVADAKK